jgi:hypothetical protein
MSYDKLAYALRSLSFLRKILSIDNKQRSKYLIFVMIIASAVSACDDLAVVAADPSCAQMPGGGLVENNALERPADATPCSSMAPLVW